MLFYNSSPDQTLSMVLKELLYHYCPSMGHMLFLLSVWPYRQLLSFSTLCQGWMNCSVLKIQAEIIFATAQPLACVCVEESQFIQYKSTSPSIQGLNVGKGPTNKTKRNEIQREEHKTT